MNKSIATRINRGYRAAEVTQQETASLLRRKGYAVDTIGTSVYVNGWRRENGDMEMLTKAEAKEVIALFADNKAPISASSSDAIYIDAVYKA